MGLALPLIIALLSREAAKPLFPHGIDLLRTCQLAVAQADGKDDLTPVDLVQSTYCTAYVSGILDGLAIMGWKGGSEKVCLPKAGISNEQAIRIVLKYLRSNPERLSDTGRVVVVVSIGQAFPCAT